MSQNTALGRSENIAKKVRKMAAAGVAVREIFSSIQTYQSAPRSMTTFYKYYSDDMDAARADVTFEIGNKVIEQAKEGDFKSQELYLTTKGGWSKNQINTNVDVATDEKTGVLDILMSKLGSNKSKEQG